MTRIAKQFLVVLAAAVLVRPAAADEPARAPVAVVAAASFDRLLGELDYVFQSADQQEPVDKIHGFLLNLNDLKGVDRARPIGLLVYMPQAEGGEPDVAGYVPVSSMEDLQATLRISNQVSLQHTGGDRWELRGGDNTLYLRVQADYAFVTRNEDLLAGSLPDVAALSGDLARDYDLAVRLSRKGLPAGVVNRLQEQFQSGLERDAARREGENDAQFQARTKLQGIVGWVGEQVLADAGDLTIGLNVSREDRTARIEAQFDSTPRSELSRVIAGLATSQPRFWVDSAEGAPLTLTTSWTLAPELQELAAEGLGQLRQRAGDALKADFSAPETEGQPVRKLLDSLDNTVKGGRLDAMVRFAGEPPGKMVMVGAIGVAQAENVAEAINLYLPFVGLSPEVRTLQMNVATAGGVSFHKITGQTVRKQDERLYGGDVALYVGAGREALWVALGGEQTPEVLEEMFRAQDERAAVAGVTDPGHIGRARVPLLHGKLHLTNWIGLAGEGEGAGQQELFKAARVAFADPERDGLALELVPTDHGLRLAISADEGYIRLIGLALAARMRQ